MRSSQKLFMEELTDPKVQQIQCPLKAKVHYDDHKLPKSTCLQ